MNKYKNLLELSYENGEIKFQELNDGAQKSFSDGLQMETISSIIEYVDNAEDSESEKVHIKYDYEEKKLIILSKENYSYLDNLTYDKIFNFGVSHTLKTKKKWCWQIFTRFKKRKFKFN